MYPRLFITQGDNNSQLLGQYYIPKKTRNYVLKYVVFLFV